MAAKVEIFVALLDEGTEAWRPVEARALDGDKYEITGKTPSGEIWQFPTGALVRCKQKKFANGTSGLVAYKTVESRCPLLAESGHQFRLRP